jgi:hypothetical protein
MIVITILNFFLFYIKYIINIFYLFNWNFVCVLH